MWTNQEVKEKARTAFKANYWPCVGISLLMSVLTGGTTFSSSAQGNSSDMQNALESGQTEVLAGLFIAFGIVSIISLLVKIFIANPVEVGGYHFFQKNTEEPGAPFGLIKTGFQNYGHTFATLFLRDLFLVLWGLLFIIPALIKGYSYCMVPFILTEHPELSATEVITRSREMMNGHKWRAFLLDLSFIGWILLGVLTLGLGLIFWTEPYMFSTRAALYLKLKEEQGID